MTQIDMIEYINEVMRELDAGDDESAPTVPVHKAKHLSKDNMNASAPGTCLSLVTASLLLWILCLFITHLCIINIHMYFNYLSSVRRSAHLLLSFFV